MTAKELKEQAQTYYFGYPVTDNDRGYYAFSAEEFETFCDALCWEFNGFMIDKHAEEPNVIPLIDDVIDEFMKEKL